MLENEKNVKNNQISQKEKIITTTSEINSKGTKKIKFTTH